MTELYGEYFVAELIEAQSRRAHARRVDVRLRVVRVRRTNKCVVGEVDCRAVGLMAITSDVELPVLQKVCTAGASWYEASVVPLRSALT